MITNYQWYTSSQDIDNPDAIHQILAYGKLEDIQQLKKKLGIVKIQDYFVQNPKKIYTKSGLNFITNYVLDISTKINQDEYLKTTLRHT